MSFFIQCVEASKHFAVVVEKLFLFCGCLTFRNYGEVGWDSKTIWKKNIGKISTLRQPELSKYNTTVVCITLKMNNLSSHISVSWEFACVFSIWIALSSLFQSSRQWIELITGAKWNMCYVCPVIKLFAKHSLFMFFLWGSENKYKPELSRPWDKFSAKKGLKRQ